MLRTKKSFTVKVVLSSVTNPFFAELFEALRTQLSEQKYTCILQSIDRPLERSDLQAVDGLLVGFAEDEAKLSQIDMLARQMQLPLVCLHWRKPPISVPAVWADLGEGIGQAVSYLAGAGCRRLSYVGGPAHDAISASKWRGSTCAAQEAGVCFLSDAIFHGPFTFQSGYDCAKRLAARQDLPDAVVCENDVLAAGVICGLSRHGVRVPQDIRVTGFDNIPLAEMYLPSITSVAVPAAEMCKSAVGKLMACIRGELVADEQFKPMLIERKS